MNSTISPVDSKLIAREILTYLREHPDAQDTIEGISQWWMLERNIKNQVGILREALASLVEDGLIVEEVNRYGLCYKLKKHQQSEKTMKRS